ncbi:MAG: hypothetical protein H0U10_16905 [Chloroflexia bacterium]|nr:hypothetical protein [Chloroflexia bacterium]
MAEFAVATLPVESDLASRSEPLADADADAPYGKEDEAVRAPMAAFTATPEAIETSDAPPSFAAALVAGAVDPARRAADLLDELRAVLPALGATRLQPAALADRLQGTLETDGEVPQGLRAALDAARRNPRDIDTMLELTQRIDDVVILIDRHDRIRDEVASAIRSLRYGEVE